jgi:hypothetical protein
VTDEPTSKSESEPDPEPEKPALDWRVASFLISIATFVIAKTLSSFALIIQQYLAIKYDLWFELGMVVGQVVFQWCVLWRRSWRERYDYALILIAISSLGAVLLWPLLLMNHISPASPRVAIGYFFIVVGIMFAVHWMLVVRAKLPKIVCATWVVYRLLILAFILKR